MQTSYSRLSDNSAKLTDLCPSEKAKIGALIKKLAEEKELREKYE